MISITITGQNRQEITDKINELFGSQSADKPAAKTEKTKLKKAEETDEPLEDETTADETVSADDVRKAIQAAAKAGNREQVKEILKKYKAKNVTELKPEKYQDVIDDLEML